MIQCLTNLSDAYRKVAVYAALITFFCCLPLFAEEQNETQDDSSQSDEQAELSEDSAQQPVPELTESQKEMLGKMGITYQEGESFEQIMLRAQQQYRQEQREFGDGDIDVSTAIDDALDAPMRPELTEARREAAKRAREEYEARRAEIMERTRNRVPPKEIAAATTPDPAEKSEEQKEQDDEKKQDEKADEPEKDVEILDGVSAKEAGDSSDVVASKEITDANKELELTITLPEKVEITALIELVGKQLGLNYIYDPAEVKGDIMLKVHDGKIKVKDTYALLESVLKFRGFVMSRRGNLVTIVPETKATEIDPMLLEYGQEPRPGDVIVTSIFRLENISTDVAQNMLTSMRLSSNIVSLPETRSVIVTGYAYRMKRIEQMLALIDVPGEKREFDYRRLEYTIASTVVDKIQALAQNLGTVEVTVAASTASQARPTPQPVRRDAQGRIIPQPAARQAQDQQQATEIVSETTKTGIYLDVDDRTNRIFMIGTKDDIAEVCKLIDTFDVPKHDVREIKQYKPLFADAADIIYALSQLGIIEEVNYQSRTSQSRTPTRTNTQQAQQQANQPSTEDYTSIEDAPQVVLLETSNSLLVNATQEQHEKIVSIIDFIDKEPDGEAAPVQVYPLINQSLDQIVETLKTVIERVAADKAAAEGGAAGSSEGKIQTQKTGTTPEVTVAGDEGTNSIVVYASKKDQEWIAKLISDLDKKRPQVLIDVTLVEIRQSDKFEFDLKQTFAKSLNETSGMVGAPMQGSTVGNYLDGSWDGSLKGFYSDTHIQALLTMIEEKNYGRVMAKPKLLVNDNQEGTIEATNSTYKPTTRIDYVKTGTETSQAVETTSWEEYEAGVTLSIKPHISEGELLRLEMTINRKDFDYASSSASSDRPYDTTTSNVETNVTVPDKSTIILGGLISINQGKGGNKVPILGDIPLVGGLFRSISNTSDQSKLYLFVKANILRPDENVPGLPQLEDESAVHREAFENWEKQFQKKQDWPGFDAEPMQPDRVLDMN